MGHGGAGNRYNEQPRSFPYLAVFLIVVAGGIGYYFLLGSDGDRPKVTNLNAANFAGADPQSQQALQHELDRQRSQRIANAVNISPALSEHQKRTEDTERMMKQLTNTTSP